MPRISSLVAVFGVAVAFTLCAPAHALELDIKSWGSTGDVITPPSGVKWQKTGVASKFKGKRWKNTVDDKEMERLYALWDKEIKEQNKIQSPNPVYPSEKIFLAKFILNGIEHRFSAASMSYKGCTYYLANTSECDWRYEAVDPQTQKAIHAQTLRMCAPLITAYDSEDGKFATSEFAVDEKKSTVFFRLLINKEVADICTQSITFK